MLKVFEKMFGKKECKKKKISAKEIQENILAIDEKLKAIQLERNSIMDRMVEVQAEITEYGASEEYAELQNRLKNANELYGILQKEMEQEYTTLKKYRDSRFQIPVDKAIMLGGVLFIGTFALALERENPKALKLATFLLKLFPMHFA